MPSINSFFANHKRAGLVCSLICIAAGLVPLVALTFYADPANPYTITPISLTSADGTRIDALAFTPVSAVGNIPGVVVGHGFTGNKRYMQPLSIELVKRGWAVVSLDFRGHGSSGGYLGGNRSDMNLLDDMKAAMDYLIGLGNVDRIGLVGHSMGGRASLGLAEQEFGWINATVSIGMVETNHNFTRIPNLLMAVGQFDQIFSEKSELDFLKAYTSLTSVELNTRYGDFGAGTACQVTIAPGIEHLAEPINADIVRATVHWFELTFHGSVRWPIVVTIPFNIVSSMITIAGTCSLVFVMLVYLANALWKRGLARPERENACKASAVKLTGLGIAASGVGLILLLPMSSLFPAVLPVSMGHQLFAILLGCTAGYIAMYYLFVMRREGDRSLASMFGRMRALCGPTPGKSFCFGILSAAITAGALTAVMDWSSTTTVLTTREVGALVGIAIVFFPFLFVKEFFFRTIQGRLAPANRIAEYGKAIGIGCIVDTLVLIPVMLLTWQNSSHSLAFYALSITVIIGFLVIQQLVVTWVYMHSGRSILGSAVFFCIFYAWMIVNFFPFGLN